MIRGVFFSILLAVPIVCSGCRDEPGIAGGNGEIVDFRLDTLGHDRFYLNQHRGKVVVLAFWSTWCTVCKTEIVELKSIAASPDYENLVVAAVCTDPENIDDVKKIVQSLGVDYPVLLDKNGTVFSKFKMAAVPTTVVIDQKGRIRCIKEGYDANIMKQIKSNIETLLASNKGAR